MLNRPKHSDREKSFTLLNPIIQCKKSYTLYCGEEKKRRQRKSRGDTNEEGWSKGYRRRVRRSERKEKKQRRKESRKGRKKL